MPILTAHITAHTFANIFGILGNAVSVGVFLSPMPTFYRIYKNKSSEGYQCIPYAVALFSAMMLLYYGSLKRDGILLITINSFGCAVEVLYLVVYLIYATKETKIFTLKLMVVFNLGACSAVMLFATFFVTGSKRMAIVGWINVVINICVFAAPLSVMRQVISTRSVKFMPISLSFALTINATMWFFYGFFLKDYYIAGPNVIGFFLGMAQMILYIVYKSYSSNIEQYPTIQETSKDSKMNTVDNPFKDNQQIELKIVYNTEELPAN